MTVDEALDAHAIDNPYWEQVRADARPSEYSWERGKLEVGRIGLAELMDADREGYRAFERQLDRQEFVGKYSWSIPDPDTVDFVAQHADGGLVDPMAGTGYWAYLLNQLGIDVACYDLHPGDNPWHRDNPLFVPVEALDGAEAVERHPDRTLLLAWPPYSESVGARIVAAYQGSQIIFIGESDGGCTGDENMHRLLDKRWECFATHTPVQWWGIHDQVEVYRKRPASGGRGGEEVE